MRPVSSEKVRRPILSGTLGAVDYFVILATFAGLVAYMQSTTGDLIDLRTSEFQKQTALLERTVEKNHASLEQSFAALRSDILRSVDDALKSRNNEVIEAIAQNWSADKYYVFSASNIPANSKDGIIWRTAAGKLGDVRYSVIGSKGILEVSFTDILGDKVLALQELLHLAKNDEISISIDTKFKNKN